MGKFDAYQAKAMQTLDRFNDLVSPEPAPEQAPESKKKAAGGNPPDR